jgi:hypothetical protein
MLFFNPKNIINILRKNPALRVMKRSLIVALRKAVIMGQILSKTRNLVKVRHNK